MLRPRRRIVCEHDGITFWGTARARFCSDTCRANAWQKRTGYVRGPRPTKKLAMRRAAARKGWATRRRMKEARAT